MAKTETVAEAPAAQTGADIVAPETTATETASSDAADAAPAPQEGIRARRAFMLKQFIPSATFITENVVAKGAGTQVVLGRVYGSATGTQRKTNQLPDGSFSESVVINGIFQAESYIDGVVSEATSVYLPMAYAEKVEAVFKSSMSVALDTNGKPIMEAPKPRMTAVLDGEGHAVLDKAGKVTMAPVIVDGKPQFEAPVAKMVSTLTAVELDCDIGLEATGKMIPYEWVVIAYREGEAMDVLKRLRNSRKRPTNAYALPAPEVQAALPAA